MASKWRNGVKIINNNQWRNIEMKWRNHQNESNNGGENNEIIINNQRVISMNISVKAIISIIINIVMEVNNENNQ
jgi:hypothetical protein